jgi:glucose/arabinose dehydrogenase
MSRNARRLLLVLITCVAVAMVLSPSTASAQKFEITPVAEKKVQQLPSGPLFWRIDNFPTLAQAQAAAGPTGLAPPKWRARFGSSGATSLLKD